MITGYYRVDEKMITFETLSDVSNYSLTKQVNIFFSNWEAYYIPQFRSLYGELFVFAIQFWQKKTTELPKISSHTYWIIQPRKGKSYWVFISKPRKFNYWKKNSPPASQSRLSRLMNAFS